MAIVVDKAGIGQLDRSYNTHNRKVAVSPVATLTPEYAGEIVLDTGSNQRWQAKDLTNTGWVLIESTV